MLDGFSTFAFGPFRLFDAERRLEKSGKPVRLGGRALDKNNQKVERTAAETHGFAVLVEAAFRREQAEGAERERREPAVEHPGPFAGGIAL